MIAPEDKIDPQLLQARWVLGGLTADELVNQALLALEQGFDGTALRQLAGLMKPTIRDLGLLPERAFADMGLKPCDRDQAVDLLILRQATLTSQTICTLVEAFPNFSERWRKHLGNWGGEPAGSYIDMAEFVHFVVEDLYEKEQFDEIRRVFELLEKLFVEGNQSARDLIGWGFFETLQCFASWRPYGNKAFEEFLGPMSKQCWREIQRLWAGKSSLMDVIRSERSRD
jgi:hypothetical protein